MKFDIYGILKKLLNKFSIPIKNKNYYVLATQHLLITTGTLFKCLTNLNIIPEHIFVNGKVYSSNKNVCNGLKEIGINVIDYSFNHSYDLGFYHNSIEIHINKMINKIIKIKDKNIIVIDDGGLTILNMPNELIRHNYVIGIEQTTSGQRLLEKLKFPVISVAASAVKKYLEPHIVIDSVFLKLEKRFKNKRIGVVGYGNIGKSLVDELIKKEYSVFVYDKQKLTVKNSTISFCESLEDCFSECEVLIGTTGEDITQELEVFLNARSNKKLISISSGDIEFNTLLKNAKKYLITELKSPLQDLVLKLPNGNKLTILRGGMVANFTGSLNSGRPKLIQLTRALLLAGVIQAIKYKDVLKNYKNQIMLSPEYQNFIVREWVKDQPQVMNMYPQELLKKFDDIEWIADNSAGLRTC